MECRKAFGVMMRNARKECRLTQAELAERVGVSPAYCREIEGGRYTPTWIIWLKICVVLNIDINCLQQEYIVSDLNEVGKYMGLSFS